MGFFLPVTGVAILADTLLLYLGADCNHGQHTFLANFLNRVYTVLLTNFFR